ncbi:TPA: hypothetical protein ACOEHF_004076 [Enterobacter hormaechei subsp. xiangfangensis]|uniref:hypothetical protein n=1 Tax=Enterobacter hormaechei TaxID=158836 RepID=UPI0012516809|nr:hypothetical protein [Enterobacter hormaechei]VAE23371.1 Uncharacterised protein [Enterobacter hormaechei]
MADWFIATEGVKVVKDSSSLWPQIFTAGAAFGGVWYGQWLITQREAKAASGKRDEERLYISTELVFLLEQFAEGCARVATDTGHNDAQGFTRSNVTTPDIDLSVVSGDWRVLPPRLMYAIREIPILQKGADRLILATEEHDDPPDYFRTFEERRYQYTRLGLRAIIQARRLRKNAGFPATRLDATEWSAQPVLWNVWRLERNRRSVQARLRLQTIAQMNIALKQSIKNNNQSGGSR